MADLTRIPEPSETSKPSESLIRKWLVILADTFQFDAPKPKEGVPSLGDIWVMVFAERSPEELVAGFTRLLETWKPEFGRRFPVPADLLEVLNAGKETAAIENREQRWQLALELIAERWRGDLGWVGAQPEPDLREAIRAAGGTNYLAGATAEQRIWAKKSFLEALARKEKLGDLHAAELLAEDVDPAVKKLLSQKIQ